MQGRPASPAASVGRWVGHVCRLGGGPVREDGSSEPPQASSQQRQKQCQGKDSQEKSWRSHLDSLPVFAGPGWDGMVRPKSNTRRKIACIALGCDSEGSCTTGTAAVETEVLILTLRRGNPSNWVCSSETGLWEDSSEAVCNSRLYRFLPGVRGLVTHQGGMVCRIPTYQEGWHDGWGNCGGAAPRRRRNDWLGFCQAHTAPRLRKVGDEPQDERANPSAWRPA